VVDQEPSPGTRVKPRESSVKLFISQGPGTVDMPNLIGETLEVARNMLERLNLNENVKVVEEPDYTQPKGYVFRQWPFEPNDPVAPGAEITLYVSSGLPADAIQTEKLITVSPVNQGVASTIEIYVSDASGDNKLWGTKEISQPTSYRVGITVSPTRNATIVINRDGAWLDSITVTYSEARSILLGGHDSGTQVGGGGTPNVQTGDDEANAGDAGDAGDSAAEMFSPDDVPASAEPSSSNSEGEEEGSHG